MKGKICLITGANGGIGYETARTLAKKGAVVKRVSTRSMRDITN